MKFLVIGLGSIGSRHAKNLIALGHEVVGYDPATPLVTNVEFINHLDHAEDIDGCIIATPTANHAKDLHYTIDRGWANILVEKPIADTISAELLNDLDYAKSVGINVVMGNNLRFHFSVRLAKRYIKTGLIGRPIWAHITVAQYNDKPQYRRDGVVLNWGAHEFDLALYLLGTAKVASSNIDSEDTIADVGLVHAESSCLTMVHLDYLTKPELRQTIIIGEKGRLVISITGRYVVFQQGDRSGAPERQQGSFDEDYMNESIAFIHMAQKKPWLGATAEDGIETLKIIDAAREMAK